MQIIHRINKRLLIIVVVIFGSIPLLQSTESLAQEKRTLDSDVITSIKNELMVEYKQGNNEAGLALAYQLISENQTQTGIAIFKEIATAGNNTAALVLGHHYSKKIDAFNPVEAARWYEQAAKSGDAIASKEMGKIYALGIGREKNTDLAKAFFETSWAEGNPEAGYNLALLEIFSKNAVGNTFPPEIAKILESLAAQEYPPAKYTLGKKLIKASGTRERGLSLIREAAEAGHPPAQYNMGKFYKTGWLVQQDMQQAVGWFRQSAETGYPKAQEDLGRRYLNGQGVPQNLVVGMGWSILAAQGGVDDAEANLSIWRSTISDDVYKEAQTYSDTVRETYKLDESGWYHLDNPATAISDENISIYGGLNVTE